VQDKAKKENPSVEIEGFLSALYGDQKGYVYAPSKNPATDHWQEYYFKWPEHRAQIVTHILKETKTQDVYVSPSLFKAPSAKRQAWKGTNYVWVEFDGNAPDNPRSGIPNPTIRIQSSVAGHEHWYWKLDEFVGDSKLLEGLAKQLTYTLDADKSGWDCNQVLRPPGTIHQDSKRSVRILASSDGRVKFSDFKNLVTASDSVVLNTSWDKVPDVNEVVAKYKWEPDAFDLFKKQTQAVGSRSSAMTKLGFYCVEMGMTNEECYSVLFNADERWGKYKNRSPEDRAKRLIGIITHCRGKKEYDAELRLSDRETFVSLGDFRTTDIKIKWLYRDFITERGLGIVSAAPGVGKSTFSIRLGLSICLAKDFLVWKSQMVAGKKVGFLSLEMAGIECKKFLEDMRPSFTEAEKEAIDKNFFLLPLGYSLPLSSKDHQQNILDEIDKHEIDFLIIDSLKAATGLDERRLDTFFDWINRRVREERGCTVWLIHHNRKPANEGPRKPRGLEDLYGDTFNGAHPTTVVSLWRKSKGILEVLPLKIRLAEEQDPFEIKRENHMDFSIYNTAVDKHAEEEPEEKVEDSNAFS
jgi:hypothetical protein